MPKNTSVFVGGETRTLSNEEFDIKFTKSIEQLEAGLTRGQRALGLYYDENQRLNDALGRCVEGLSIWQMKLGMWIDETGKARTVAGGFADGLTRTELELGYYADELGNVRTRTGEFVRETKAAIDAQNEQHASMQRTREAFADAFDSIGDGAGRMASLLTQLDGLSGGADEARQKMIRMVGAVDAASQAFSSMQNLGAWFREARTSVVAFNSALATSATTAQGFNAAITAIGGPWAIVAAGAAAATSALFLFSATAKDTGSDVVEKTEKIAASFEEVKRRAKEAGEVIKGIGDVLQFGAFYQEDGGLGALEQKMNDAMAKIERLELERKLAQETASEVSRSAGMGGASAMGGVWKDVDRLTDELATARDELEPLQSRYNEIAAELVRVAREEQMTEEEKANALVAQYENILKFVETEEDRQVLQNKIKSIEDGIATARSQELANAEKRIIDQRNALAKELGVSLDFSPPLSQVDLFAADLEKLRQAYSPDGTGLISSLDELEEAQRRLAEQYSNESADALSKLLAGVTSTDELEEFHSALALELQNGLLEQKRYNELLEASALKEQELIDAKIAAIPGLKEMLDVHAGVVSEADEYGKALETANLALEQELIDRETYNDLVNAANENLAKATDDAARKLRDDVRSELGIDSIMESLKSPAQKFAEQIAMAEEALKDQHITQSEFNAFQHRLEEELLGKDERFKYEDKFKDVKGPELDKTSPAKSMEAGSSDLYLALVKNQTSGYQSKIQTTTENMYRLQQEALDVDKETNFYLWQLVDQRSSEKLPVYG